MFPKRAGVYLDTAATSLKSTAVIQSLLSYYENGVAPVHRSVYPASQKATHAFESTRDAVQKLIGASDRSEIVFTKGTTESLNLIAATYGDMVVTKGDEIIISEMEHHANIVPWYELAKKKQASIKVIPVLEDGHLDYDTYAKLLSCNTKIVAVTHVSNVLGTINDLEKIYKAAKQVGATVVVDGAQAIAHIPVTVTKYADFYAFSGHKMYGPEGVGVLYGKKDLLGAMPPYQTGGAMIESVAFDTVTYQKAPWKFEAGTPSTGAVIALQQAVALVMALDHEKELEKQRAYRKMLREALPEATFYGPEDGIGMASFTLPEQHPLDVATLLGVKGVAIRSGHMCAEPLLRALRVSALLRVSFGIYTTERDIQVCIDALHSIKTLTTTS